MKLRVVFRVDASARRGLGHLVRCLALAQALRDRKAECVFLTVRDPALSLVERERFPTQRLARREPARGLGAARTALERLRPDVLVADSYDLTPRHHAEFRAMVRVLALVDDDPRGGPRACDLVVNGNVYGNRARYDGARRALLGPRYALLRPVFREAAARAGSATRSGLVLTLGGSDPRGLTFRMANALRSVPEARPLAIIVGARSRCAANLKRLAGSAAAGLRVLADPTPVQLRDAFLGARLALSASGSTLLELAACGTPAVVVTVANHQRPVANAFAARGAAVPLGDGRRIAAGRVADEVRRLLGDRKRLASMSRAMRRLVDGQGAGRVAEAILRPLAAARPPARER